MSEPRKILVVANETLAGDELLDAVRRRVEGTDAVVLVIAPVNAPREGYVVYENTRRAAAGRRLDQTLLRFREAGIPASGHVVDNDPLTAVKDAIAIEQPDELVVSTHPEAKSGWRRRNLLDEIPRVVGGPYEFGVPGTKHAIMGGEGSEAKEPEPAVAGSST